MSSARPHWPTSGRVGPVASVLTLIHCRLQQSFSLVSITRIEYQISTPRRKPRSLRLILMETYRHEGPATAH